MATWLTRVWTGHGNVRDDTILESVKRHHFEEPEANGVELSSERQFRVVQNQLVKVWRGVLGGNARIPGRSGFAGPAIPGGLDPKNRHLSQGLPTEDAYSPCF